MGLQLTTETLNSIPNVSGVYFFKGVQGEVIYIGKSKRLRTRLRSYLNNKNNDWKIASLIRDYHSIDYVATTSELEALMLEAQLVKQFKPHYNVLLKSGQPFLYIHITQNELPEMRLVRTRTGRGEYFGPFIHKKNARSGYHFLLKTFRLKLCSVKITGGCLDYHLGMCAGTCQENFDINDYKMNLELARGLLKENFNQVEQLLREHISEHSSKQEFEKARNLYDYLTNLKSIFDAIKTRFSTIKYEGEVLKATAAIHSNKIYKKGLEQLQALLKLKNTPETIDCFDVSHFQSSYITGSCVRFTDGEPDARGYRRFRIKTLKQQNDYAALQEIVTRRYKKSTSDIPGIVLIDGGKGQRDAVASLIPGIICLSIAKREERLFTPLHPNGIVLETTSEIGQLITALRDYAHHCAIRYHKLLRSKGGSADEQ